jgi:hypothetical protein
LDTRWGSSRLGFGIRSPSRSANVNARQLPWFPEFLFQFQRCDSATVSVSDRKRAVAMVIGC